MAKSLKMTKAHQAKLDKLDAARDAAMSAVFRAAPDGNTPFHACLEMASRDVATAYRDACDALAAFKLEMVAEGRGWLNGGSFVPYA